MTPTKEPPLRKDEPPPKPSRLEEARQVNGEYAALREIINRLRRRMN